MELLNGIYCFFGGGEVISGPWITWRCFEIFFARNIYENTEKKLRKHKQIEGVPGIFLYVHYFSLCFPLFS